MNNSDICSRKRPNKIDKNKFFSESITSATTVISKSLSDSKKHPEQENIVINTNYNSIIDLDRIIKEKILQKRNLLPSYEKDLLRIQNIKHHTDSEKEKILCNEKLKQLRVKINNITSEAEYLCYIRDTSNIIEEYKKIDVPKGMNNFLNYDPNLRENKDSLLGRNKLRTIYLNILSKYVYIENQETSMKEVTCRNPDCNSEEFYFDSYYFICKVCGIMNSKFDENSQQRDNQYLNNSNRFKYFHRKHLCEAIKCFEGEQTISNKDEIVAKVKKEMEFMNIKTENLTKLELMEILNKNDMSDQYNNIELLYSTITGSPLYDIKEYKQKILHYDTLFSEVYEQMETDRISQINVNFKLYKYLQLTAGKDKFPKSCFLLLRTVDVLTEHINIFNKVADYYSWEKFNDE